MSTDWPRSEADLVRRQREVARLADAAPPWRPPASGPLRVAAVFVAFPTGCPGPGAAGDPALAAAVLWETPRADGGPASSDTASGSPAPRGTAPSGTAPHGRTVRGQRVRGRVVAEAVVEGEAGAPYLAGLLALRAGPLSERVVRSLVEGLPPHERGPDMLLVDATGRDHPRRAGLAVHLGLVLDLPSVGVTNRALAAAFESPGGQAGAVSPLVLDAVTVGFALRSRRGVNPVLVHAGWCTDPETALDVVRLLIGRWRTPEPLRLARRSARVARARAEQRLPS